MPIRGIQDYLSSGEATEEYFDAPTDGNQLLTKNEIDAEIPPLVRSTVADGSVDTIYKGGTADGNQVLNKQEVLALPPADVANVEGMQYIPQDPAPDPVEGLTYYDDTAKALTVFSNRPDFALNLGQEEVIRVYNNTGVTIPNGTPCYITGAFGGLPTVAPAIADTLATSVVPGISTHDIANGEAGFITHAGVLGGDFSSFAVGDILYLSDTVAGEFVTVPPDITTVCGSVLDNGVDGSLLVRISSHIALPTAIGYLQTMPGTFEAATAYANIAGYSISDSVYVGVDATTGILTPNSTGIYRVTASFSLSIAASLASSRSIQIQLYDITTGANFIYNLPVPRDETQVSGSFATPFSAEVGDELVLRMASPDTIPGITFELLSFDITSIHLA